MNKNYIINRKGTFFAFLILMCFSKLSVFANKQDSTIAKELLIKATAHLDSSHLAIAEDLLTQATPLYESIWGTESLEYAALLHQKGELFSYLNDTGKRKIVWKKSYAILLSKSDANAIDMGWSSLLQSKILSNQLQYDSVFLVINKTLDIAKNKSDNYLFLEGLIRKADVLHNVGEDKESLILLDSALIWRENYFPENLIMKGRIFFLKGLVLSELDTKKEKINLEIALALFKEVLGVTNYRTAACHFFLGNHYFYSYDYQLAEKHFTQANNIFEQIISPTHLYSTQTVGNLATVMNAQGENEEAISIYHELIEKLEKSPDGNEAGLESCYQNAASIYSEQGNPFKAIEYIQKALAYNAKDKGQYAERGSLYSNLANYYLKATMYEEAIIAYGKGVAIFDACHTQYCNKRKRFQLGTSSLIHLYLGDDVRALEGFRETLDLEQQAHDTSGMILAYLSMGNALHQLEKNDRAKIVLEKSLRLIKTTGMKVSAEPPIHNTLGSIYTDLKQYEKAETHFKRAIRLEKKINPNSGDLSRFQSSIGALYWIIENYRNAKKYNKASLNTVMKLYGQSSTELVYSLTNLAITAFKQKEWVEASSYFKQAKKILNIESEEWDLSAGADTYQIFFSSKHSFFEAQLKATGESRLLDSIIIVGEKALRYKKVITNSLTTDASKAVLAKNMYFLYPKLIDAHYQKSLLASSEKSYHEASMYQLSEQGLQQLFRANVVNLKTNQFSGISEIQRLREKSIQQKIRFLEKRLEIQVDKLSLDSIETLRFELAKIKNTYFYFSDSLQTAFPKYYELKYQNEIASIEQVQNQLKLDESLVKYIETDTAIYALVIAKDDFKVRVISRDSVYLKHFLQIKDLYQQEVLSKKEMDSINIILRTSAHFLYQALIKPIQPFLKEKLIIIPDYHLVFLSFDMLLTQQISQNIPYKGWPFLLRDYAISYANSATLFAWYRSNITTSNRRKHHLLAMAPSFSTKQQAVYTSIAPYQKNAINRSNFQALRWNKDEVRFIADLFEEEALVGPAATLAAFQKNVSSASMIHLSSHAKANAENGNYSLIAFTASQQDSTEEWLLYVKDLYGLEMDADLVVLSACETALGEIRQGEGVIGLAQGFAYAGAKSLVTSLWKIDDEQTKNLMKQFYENLQNGMTKEVALQQAKLWFINEYNSSPRSWAAFVLFGNMDAIDFPATNYCYYFIGFIVLLGLTFLVKKRY